MKFEDKKEDTYLIKNKNKKHPTQMKFSHTGNYYIKGFFYFEGGEILNIASDQGIIIRPENLKKVGESEDVQV